MANEIISIQYAYGDAFAQLNDNNAVEFAAKVESLADRLEQISKELDAVGPFPADLREATIKKLIDANKAMEQLLRSKNGSGLLRNTPLPLNALEIIRPVIKKYFAAWVSVRTKARLYIEAADGLPGIHTNYQGTNNP